ncbi:hypothetical protein [Motiliproteus sediminis]|uniref:hypothetical protein n=1 Tax=Motiliproteus sediminis TaxID=1468178 RepID=UPI001AEFA246|nr:hypothetical protein [Motiliproteus sediminis]
MNRGLVLLGRHWMLLSAGLLTAISLLSLWPLTQLPEVPGSDKTHHLVAYAALMLPAAYARPRGWLWLGLFFLGWSGAIELLQPLVNRYGEWLDLAANAAGLVTGITLAALLRLLRPTPAGSC